MRVLVATVLTLAIATPAGAQWVTFDDQTSTRLSFTPFVDAPAGNPMQDDEEKDIATADLDRDGDTDAVVVRKRPFSTPGARQDVLLMNENGVLTDRTAALAPGFISSLTDARDVFIGDFDGDEWPDVVIASTFGGQPKFYHNLGLDAGQQWLGLADESAARFPTINVGTDVSTLQFCAVWGGDVSGNGAPDLYFSNYVLNGGTTDVLFVNNGSGVFTNETAARLGDYANVSFGSSVEIHDMDDDGDNDIVKVSTLYAAAPFSAGQFILFNDGNGVFNNIPYQRLPNSGPYMFTVADFNNDGLLDQYLEDDAEDLVALAVSTVPDLSIIYNTVTLSASGRVAGFGGNTKAADIDRDGFIDVGVAPIDVDIQNCGDPENDFALLRNLQNGILEDPWPTFNDQNIHSDPHDFAFMDVDNDGCLDIVMGLCTGWDVFIQNDCPAPDVDGDGVPDDMDNCTLVANADQRDTNGDGYGNICDGDFNDDNNIDFLDLGIMKQAFFSADADTDLTGDGIVDFLDLGLLKQSFFGQPGPSGALP